MRILYVGTELAEAQAIATAVNSLGELVMFSWTSSLDRVANWIDKNDGLRVLVVEARPHWGVWRSVLTYVAGLPTVLPVVVIVPEEIASDLQPLALDAHECIARKASLLRNLPAVVTRAIDRARQPQLERGVRADLELKLVQATAAIQEAEHRHRSATAAAAEQLVKSQSQFEKGMARAAAMRDMANEQFREAAIEVERVRQRHASVLADAERLARREAELSVQLDSAARTRAVLEHRLADAETALHAGEARAAEERRSLAELVARQRQFVRQISDEIDKRRGVENTLAHALSAGTAAEQGHASAMTAAVVQSRELQAALSATRHELESKAAHLDVLAKRAAELEAELEEQIRQECAARAALEEQIADGRAALVEARRENQSAAADVARRIEREASLTSELSDAHATALRDEQQRHDVALARTVGELAERQAHFDRERAEAEARCVGLTAQLREIEEAGDQSRREHESVVANVTRLTEREAELEGRLKEEHETRDALEQQVAGAAAALRNEQERHHAALAAAAAERAEHQAHFERERAQAEAERAGHTVQWREVEVARDQARREHESAVGDLTRATEHAAAEREAAARCQAELEARLSRANEKIERLQQTLADTRSNALDAERLLNEEIGTLGAASLVQAAQFGEQRREHGSRLAKAQDLNSTLARERLVLQLSFSRIQDESHRRDREYGAERERLEHVHTAASAVIRQLNTERQEIERRFEETRSTLQDALDRLNREHAAMLATRENDIEQLRISLNAGVEELEVTKRQREVLQAVANQLPGLQHELHQSRADNHRLFQQGPVPMFRCTKDGLLAQANRMLTILVGRRSAEELRGADLAAAIFESPNDLSWLIERCLGSRGKESTETTWCRKDGSRLLVRLSAYANSSDLIECAVEDLTPIRVLHDRLSQAHRMEAVGRLATEVAVTCGTLLSGVHQSAEQWLTMDGTDPASRYQREMLLQEVSRAAGLLRQLAAYGDEESRRPAVVELRTVVRDVAPVLRRVAGDAVEVQLPAASTPLKVDAGVERVKRLLVNLAAYGRERMPFGGRLKIELGTVVVDRHFAAKHPNVRLGPHALLTVTESRRATPTDGRLQLHDNEAGPSSRSVAVQTGVDLGTLQELIRECGGHLWMTVEPAGDMVVKIRLPLATSYGEPLRRTLTVGGRMRSLGHWFQH